MTCSVEGCAQPVSVKRVQLCRGHYYRLRVHGDPLGGRVGPDRSRICSVEGCSGRGRSRGLCDKHYRRWLNHGDPLTVLPPRGPEPITPAEFWKRVDSTTMPQGCWPWLGQIGTGGYGKIKIGGRTLLAHRVAYRLASGVDPGDLMVCHRCDNRVCCNPAHHFLGTALDNNRDKTRKERQARGETNGNHKLTEAQVAEIRGRRAAGEGIQDLGRAFGVAHTQISAITRRKSWRHVT